MHENGARRHDPGAFREIYLRTLSLSLYRQVLEDEIGQEALGLLEDLSDLFLEEGDEEDLIDNFAHFTSLLLAEAAHYSGEIVGDLWQNHLLDRLLADSNLFSASAERGMERVLGQATWERVEAELDIFRRLAALSLNEMQRAVAAVCRDAGTGTVEAWPAWDEWDGTAAAEGLAGSRAGGVKRRLLASGDWASLAGLLASYYADTGTGLFGRYRAFRWAVRDGNGTLEGVAAPDPIGLQQLIGYDREQQVVLRNTRHFLAGAPANNVLLYGDAGTGKSSLIKALLNAFEDQGLRLVEVMKEHLGDFPHIAQLLRDRKERFILFVDDLSFEEHETEYKGLKALLEGSIDARPENVLIYATSNRRHLVKEYFGDRPAPSEEDVHPQETSQEKLSLSDRFGVRVAFLAPDQERYLTIVSVLARQEGLDMEQEELRRRAFQWAQWQNGFSGRTARQFINDLKGELLTT